jgi:hypothetical protein
MTSKAYNMRKAKEIADHLLGKGGMSKYPSLLLVGLLLISISIKKSLKTL